MNYNDLSILNMKKLYKPEKRLVNSNKEILVKKILPSDDIEDQELNNKINSTIESIQFMYSSHQINNQLFDEIIILSKLIKVNQSQFLPILINSEIIQYLFETYQDQNLNEIKLSILRCLNELSNFGFAICDIFLQEGFLQLFEDHFSFEDCKSNYYLIQIYYNILNCVSQQTTIDQILQVLSIRDFYSLAKNIEDDNDILCYTIFCLGELMKHTIDDINDENILYEIIHYYFFERQLHVTGSNIIQNIFPRNFLAMLKNRLYFYSFNYELFENYDLFKFLDFYLHNPPIENFSVVCDIISLLIDQYQCEYKFDIEIMIENFLKFESEKNQYSSVNSIDYMIRINALLSNYFFNNDCHLFLKFIDSFLKVSLKTKISLFQLIFDLLQKAKSNDWVCIFEAAQETNDMNIINDDDDDEEKQSHASLILIISQILFYEKSQNDTDKKTIESIDVLNFIFEKASQLDYLDFCYGQFDEIFGEEIEDLFDLNDEKTLFFFNKYFPN